MALGVPRGTSPRGRRRRLPLLVCLACAAVIGLGRPTVAEDPRPYLDSVVVEASVEPGRPLLVSMDYFLHPEGADSVSFSALTVDGRRAANVRAFLGERELSFRIPAATGDRPRGRLEGRIELPPASRQRERFHLRLLYEVLPTPVAAEEITLVLPMLVAGWPPLETERTTFVATVRLPRSLSVLDSFPSEFDRLESPDRARGTEAYRFSLPVVPALVRIRAGDEGASRLTAARALDLGAVVALAALALYGWRRVRGHLR